MAQTATRRRNGHAAKRKPPTKSRRGPTHAVEKATEAAKEAAPSPPGLFKLSGSVARKAAKKLAGKAADSGAETFRSAAERALVAAGHAVSSAKGVLELRGQSRPPIQRSLDLAVPISLAWEEWMCLRFLPEGAHRVEEIEREGTELAGHITGPHPSVWAAQVLDEREEQSFAWQSSEGSDCAGLVTFHCLSERLTRIELNLDVVPTSPSEALALLTHLADRRAEVDLRHFKARLELISPDLYEKDEEPEDGEPDDEEPPRLERRK